MDTNTDSFKQKKLKFLKVILLAGIVVVLFMAGYRAGEKGYVFQGKDFKIINRDKAPKEVDYSLLWDAMNVINTKYIEKPVDAQKVLYGAIRGAVSATGDPYTDFFEPKQLASFKTDLQGTFNGIGAEISKKNGLIMVIAPLDESPAKKAGLLPKDIITEVDGQSTLEWSVEEAVEKIRGPKGTMVKLTIVREGKDKPLEFSIVRQKIEIKSVKLEIKTLPNGEKAGVISITRFGEDTEGLLQNVANNLLTQNVKNLIVDLRNNPGGYLETAVRVASFWVKKGEVVVQEAESSGETTLYKSEGSQPFAGMKTVVLINSGSASASEILAGALSDHKLAVLIGEKSFGKGSVQEIVDLKDGSGVKVTIAKWITPGGKHLNKDGLVPDVEVKLSEDDIKNEKDPQMEKAMEEIIK